MFWRRRLIVATKQDANLKNLISWNKEDAFPEILHIRIIGGSKADILSMLAEAKPSPEGIPIWIGDYADWRFIGRRTGRPLRTVVMDQAIIADARRFLASRAQYKELGIPYRRGYLFHGPPGTGKTSACLALATELELSIYLIPSTVTDKQLQSLMANLPPRALVLMEDVDRLFEKNEDLSSSGLLNAIDGIADSDGRLLILTSNNRDALDAALVREGRCDKHFNFVDLEPGKQQRAKLLGMENSS